MRAVFVVLLSLCLGLSANAQTIVMGNAVPQKEVEAAKNTVSKANPKSLKLGYKEFEVVEMDPKVVSPVLWLSTNTAIVEIIKVNANQSHSIYLKRRGEDKERLHYFPARPKPWLILVGIKSGAATVNVIANAEKPAEEPPAVIDTLLLEVGDGTAPDDNKPPVIEDELVKKLKEAYNKDLAAAKAEKRWIPLLAKVYTKASQDSLDSVKTIGDLDDMLTKLRKAESVPEPDQMLTALRTVLQYEMYDLIGVSASTPDIEKVPVSIDVKRRLKPLFTKFAKSLEVVGS